MIALWLTMACAPKELPAHLRVDQPTAQELSAVPLTDDASALSVLLGKDPLARHAAPGEPGRWAGLPSAAALEDWASLTREASESPQDWQALEARWPGTIVVGLARGSQLGHLEVQLAGEGDRPLSTEAIAWIGPLRVGEQIYPRDAGSWLADDAAQIRDNALYLAERRVVLGWLSSPKIPLEPVAAAMDPGLQGRLMEAPAGRLILARVSGAAAVESGGQGRALLERATTLALREAAADADKEQAAWRVELGVLRAELDNPDPISELLARARDQLTEAAATDEFAGLGLVALTAERLRGSCPDQPCTGLDRTSTLVAARTWGREVGGPAAVWTLIGLKTATDAFEASWKHPSFKTHAPLLADTLLGTGAASMDLGVLRVPTANPGTMLAVARGAGRDGVTDFEGARWALRERLAETARRALVEELPAEQRQLVERVLRRAEG